MTERFDVLVVGAGPAGMAAAVTAGESGARVAIIDETPRRGGQLWHSSTIPDRARPWFERLEATNATVFNSTSVIDAQAPASLLTTRGFIEAEKLVLACGARELLLPFPGWTLPGVTGAGGLQALVHDGLDVSGQRIVVAGTGPLLLQVTAVLREHRARVLRVAEQASLTGLLRFARRLSSEKARQGLGLATTTTTKLRTSSWVVGAEGSDRVQSVTVRTPFGHDTIECDRLAVGFSLVPNLELPHGLGCDTDGAGVIVDSAQATSIEHVFAAGEVCGIKGAAGAIADGVCAGLAATGQPIPGSLLHRRDAEREFGRRLGRTFALRPEISSLANDDTIFCRCEDVITGAVSAHPDWTSAKLHTRCGMGSCQGRVCGAASHQLFGWGPTGVRPPFVPVPISDLMHERTTP